MAATVIAMLLLCSCATEGRPADGGALLDGGRDGGPTDGGAADASDSGPGADGGAMDAGGSRIDALVARIEGGEGDAVLHEVAWAEGWPVHEGARWLFATAWADAPADVALVGDVDGWDPAAAPASAAPDGEHFWVVLEDGDFVSAPEGAKYKWWGTGDVFRAPPEATAYGFDDFGEHGFVRPPLDRPWRERFGDLESAHLEEPRAVRALLPAGFTRGDPVRTLLLHDGQNVFDPTAPYGGWRVDEALADPAFADVLVVAVDNTPDRMDAYTHVPDEVSGTTVGGRADDYLALLLDEVLPFVRDRYGIDARGSDLTIAGSSLGGLVTLYVALEAPELAGCVAALSPTLGWGAFAPGPAPDALVRRFEAAGHGPVAIYLDSGGDVTGACADPDGDGVWEDSDDSDNYCVTVQLRDTLASAGYAYDVDLFHWHEAGAPHREDAWAARVPRFLDACASAGWIAR